MSSQWDCDPCPEGEHQQVFTCDGCERDTYSVEDRLCRDCATARDRRERVAEIRALVRNGYSWREAWTMARGEPLTAEMRDAALVRGVATRLRAALRAGRAA